MSFDLIAIWKIVCIDILLGTDNAVVIALACAALATQVRNKAIFFGTGAAIAMRVIFLFFTSLLFGLTYVKLIAGLYLIYIGYKLLADSEDDEPDIKKSTNIWGAVMTIAIADVMMSLDNVLAVYGAAQSNGASAIYYAIGGIIISIPIIIGFAKGIMALMDRFPAIIWFGAMILGWVGAEMILSEPVLHTYVAEISKTTELMYKTAGFLSVGMLVYLKSFVNKFVTVKE